MKRILTFFSSLGLLLGFTIAPAFATAGGPTCSVPTDYSTIQAAVNVAGCTTIDVAAGTYNENVNINHSVILNGPNVGITGNGTRVSEASVSSINITASNVTVDGFSFTNSGVQMNINGSTTLSGVKVQNNIFSGYSSVGFPTYNAGNLLITRNLFQSPATNSEAIQIKADGSTTGGCNGTEVNDNVFTAASNNGGADINFSCTGSNSTDVTVSGNTDTGLNDSKGTSFTAFSGVTGGISITNNHVTGTANSGSAVFFFGSVSGNVSITGNDIVNGAGSAISIHGADITSDTANTGTFTIVNNDLSGNGRGVYVAAKALSSGAKVITNKNNLSGDTVYGVDNENAASIVVDGTCNWWGDASGPGLVASGTGSKVSTNVTYTPWLVSSDLNGSCTGGTVTVTIAKYLNGSMATAGSASNASYPMVSTWSATNIGSGTGNYTLSPSGFNNANPYQATTSYMTSGANYKTSEVTNDINNTSNVLPIDATCQPGMTQLVGYSTGGTLLAAAGATPTSTAPNFTGLTANEFVVVWNKTCPNVTPTPTLVGPPVSFAQCKDNGWKTFNNPSFKNQGKCIDYVEDHLGHVEGNVRYTAFNLKRQADFEVRNTGKSVMSAMGMFFYTDANHARYQVMVRDLKVSGKMAWFAGKVVHASNSAWVGQWLIVEISKNSPSQIWGSFTNQTTAANDVMNMTSPADGPFNITSGNLNVH